MQARAVEVVDFFANKSQPRKLSLGYLDKAGFKLYCQCSAVLIG